MPPEVLAAITTIEGFLLGTAPATVEQVYAAAVVLADYVWSNLPLGPFSAHRLSAVRCDKAALLANLASLKAGNVGAISWATLLAQVLAFLASLGIPIP